MKRIIATAILVTFPIAALAANDGYDKRLKDAMHAQEICAKHTQGKAITTSTSYGLVMGYSAVTTATIGGSYPPIPIAYESGWEKCYEIDKSLIDLKKEGEERDRSFVLQYQNKKE